MLLSSQQDEYYTVNSTLIKNIPDSPAVILKGSQDAGEECCQWFQTPEILYEKGETWEKKRKRKYTTTNVAETNIGKIKISTTLSSREWCVVTLLDLKQTAYVINNLNGEPLVAFTCTQLLLLV